MARKPAANASGAEPVAARMIVTAKAEGFRRAGRAWSVAPTEVSVDEFSDAELLALAGEPMLDVVFVGDGPQ